MSRIALRHGDYEAWIDTGGARLAALRFRRRDLVVPLAAGDVELAYSGAVLAPWPNRVVDGRYRFGGRLHELEQTEPLRGHALHGLVTEREWEVVRVTRNAVRLTVTIDHEPGYPFRLALAAEFALGVDGLRQAVRAENVGDATAPYGVGVHPYLTAGEGTLDSWEARIPASVHIPTDGPRLLPLEPRPVAESFDFRTPRRLGSTRIDHAFGGWETDAPQVDLRARDGAGVRMNWDPRLPWLQVCTADDADPRLRRRGLAVEPMSCPPDAYNSGRDLVALEPGAVHRAWWRIERLPSGS